MEPEVVFRADRSAASGTAVVRCAGELDISTVPRLAELLNAVDGDVTVDLAGLTFLDSSGINALLLAADRREAQGHTLRVVSAQPHVRRVLEIAGVAERLLSSSPA